MNSWAFRMDNSVVSVAWTLQKTSGKLCRHSSGVLLYDVI